jgi:hypothetical protein
MLLAVQKRPGVQGDLRIVIIHLPVIACLVWLQTC